MYALFLNTSNQAIPIANGMILGEDAVVAGLIGNAEIAPGGGLRATTAGSAFSFKIVLPADIGENDNFRAGAEFHYGNDDVNYIEVKLKGRLGYQSLGLQDDPTITGGENYGGHGWRISDGWFVPNLPSGYHTIKASNATNGRLFGWSSAILAGDFGSGVMTSDFGTPEVPLSNGGDSTVPTEAWNSWSRDYVIDAGGGYTGPMSKRMRVIEVLGNSNANTLKSIIVESSKTDQFFMSDRLTPAHDIPFSVYMNSIDGSNQTILRMPVGTPKAWGFLFHPNANSAWQICTSQTGAGKDNYFAKLLAAGYAVFTMQGDTTFDTPLSDDWGAPVGTKSRSKALDAVKRIVGLVPVFGIAISMGGATMDALERLKPGTFNVALYVSAVRDVAFTQNNGDGPGLKNKVDAAFAADGGFAANQKSNPMANLPSYKNKHFLMRTFATDNLISANAHTKRFFASALAYGANATLSVQTGTGHLDLAVWNGDEAVAYLDSVMFPDAPDGTQSMYYQDITGRVGALGSVYEGLESTTSASVEVSYGGNIATILLKPGEPKHVLFDSVMNMYGSNGSYCRIYGLKSAT